ncbi:pirin family protein [Streptomyces sp. NPDC004646]
MIEVRRADERHRGGDPEAGIDSRHAFSFGPHYDPDNLRFGALIACNEERLAPGAGFAEHPHSHTEIVTWVAEGELTHRDSTGHASVIRPGDVQHLSAAAGVRHSERNEGTRPLVFVQMWLTPSAPGGEPSYAVARDLTEPYAVPGAGAALRVLRPAPGERTALPGAPFRYVHVVRGEVRLADGTPGIPGSGDTLRPGDSARITGARGVELAGVTDAEVLLWAMES